LTWKVKDWYTFDTLTNCATVSWSNIQPQVSWSNIQPHEHCVTTTPPAAPYLNIDKKLLTTWDMTAGSTVAYKITLTNTWNAVAHNAYILDILPNAIQYQTSSIQNIINYSFEEWTTWNNEYYIQYYDFDLAPDQSAIVYLTWVLKEWFHFEETTNCAFTSWDFDCELLPSSPTPYVQKYQKIGTDTGRENNGWTTDILTVELWDFISYRIDFGNLWNKAATGEVKDVLPECVEYISAHLVGAIWVWPTYNQFTRHTVLFSNIPLAAWQTAHMMVVGKIKQEDGCQSVTWYLNTWMFHFVGQSRLTSEVLAVRPITVTDVEITKTVTPEGIVEPWQVLTYTINYKNNWPEELQSYTIVDYWPSEQLEYSGVVSMNPQAYFTQRDWNIIRWTFNTPLSVGETWQIVLQWVVK